MKKILFAAFILLAVAVQAQNKWVGTWATAIEKANEKNMPNTALTNNALRQTIRVSLGGQKLRLQLSNELSAEPLEIKSVYIADAQDTTAINASAAKFLTFNGKKNVSIEKGKFVYSDAISYNLKPLQKLSITINYGVVPSTITMHRGSRTTSFIMTGETQPKSTFNTSEKIEHWYTISALEVEAPKNTPCIACIGNSITDGRGTTTDANERWTDVLAEELGGKVGVLNLGIGGNCVLQGGLGIPAVDRFQRDILSQQGVTTVVLFEGINDIGGSKNRAENVTKRLLTAYQELIDAAHAKGLKIYGGTITPFKNNSYWTYFHDAARMTVNEWIRTCGKYDGVLDFEQQVIDPQHPDSFQQDLQDDWLHPNPKGYKVMGKYAAQQISELIK